MLLGASLCRLRACTRGEVCTTVFGSMVGQIKQVEWFTVFGRMVGQTGFLRATATAVELTESSVRLALGVFGGVGRAHSAASLQPLHVSHLAI